MAKSEHIETLLKNSKRFTLLLAIICMFIGVVYVMGSALLLMHLQEIQIPTSALIITLIMTAVYIIFCVMMYILNARLKKGQIVSRTPYLIFLVFQVIIAISELLTGSMTFDRMFMVAALILVPILIISNLRKIEHIKNS